MRSGTRPPIRRLLGLLRICTGLMLVYTHAVWGLALNDFFGPTSWLSPALVRSIEAGQYTYSFWFWVPLRVDVAGLRRCRWLIFVLLHARALDARDVGAGALHGDLVYPPGAGGPVRPRPDQHHAHACICRSVPADRRLSLDRWLLRRRLGEKPLRRPRARCANLAQRLIQVHMCVIYLFAGISKLQGPSWWSGEAMWRAFANLEYQSLDMTWLAWHPWLVNLMTHVSVVWEISFCVLIWKPLWRPLMLAGAVVLHVGIGLCLGMWTFGLIMLVGCASFLPNEAVRRVAWHD